MDIELKSGCVIEDLDEIARLLIERQKKAESLDTVVTIDADEGPIVSKAMPGVASPPQVDPAKVESLARSVGIEFTEAHRDRVVSYWASDERVDGEGDIIRQKWDFSRFEKNPVMPFSHEWRGLPVANAIDWGVVARKDKDYDGPALWLAGLFPTEEESGMADSIFRLVKSGFLKGGSVGFKPLKITRIEDPEERKKLGLGTFGVIFEKSLLVEFSPVTVPANPGAHTALSVAKREGHLRAEEIPLLRELVRRGAVARGRTPDDWAKEDAAIVAVAKGLFADSALARSLRKHADMGAPILDEKRERAIVRVDAADPIEENVAAIRTAVDEGFAGVFRRLDEISDENVELRRRLEEMEARNLVGVVTQSNDEPLPEIPISFDVSERLLRGLDALKAGK